MAMLGVSLSVAGLGHSVVAQGAGSCEETLFNRLHESLPVASWVVDHIELSGSEWSEQLQAGNEVDVWRASALELLVEQIGTTLEDTAFLTAAVDVPEIGLGEITAVRACGTNSDALLLLVRPLFSDTQQEVISLAATIGAMTWIERTSGLPSLAVRDGDTVYVGGNADPVMSTLVVAIASATMSS